MDKFNLLRKLYADLANINQMAAYHLSHAHTFKNMAHKQCAIMRGKEFEAVSNYIDDLIHLLIKDEN